MATINKHQTYWILKEKYDLLERPCGECWYDECAKNPLRKQLKRTYKAVIDYEYCLKQSKKERTELQTILEHPFFKKQNSIKCSYCKRKLLRTRNDHAPVMEPKIDEKGAKHYMMKTACKRCSKKHQTKW